MQQSYGWGGDFDGDAFLRSLGILVRAFGGNAGLYAADRQLVAQYYAPGSTPATGVRNLILSLPLLEASVSSGGALADIRLAFLGIPIPPSPTIAAPPDGLAFMPVITGQAADTIALSDRITLKLSGDVLEGPVCAEVHPGSAVVRATPGDAQVAATVQLAAKAPSGSPWIAIGAAGSSRLEVAAAHVGLGLSGQVDGDLDFSAEVGLDAGTLVIDFSDADSFVKNTAGSGTLSVRSASGSSGPPSRAFRPPAIRISP